MSPVPQEHRLAVGGLSCAACARRAERALAETEGVLTAHVSFAAETASVAVESDVDPSRLVAAVERAGFTAAPEADDRAEAERSARAEKADRRDLYLLAGAVVLTVPLLLPMVLAPWGLAFEMPGSLQLALALPIQVLVGARFYRGALAALRHRATNMDVLVALGTTAAFGLSLVGLSSGGPLYFESSAVILTALLLGKTLERRAKRQTLSALRALSELTPTSAELETERGGVRVPLDAIGAGRVVVVRPGERLPVDGKIVEGDSVVDESMVTGESIYVARGPGDTVLGGTLNGSGLLRVEATAVGDASTLAGIARSVKNAQLAKAPVEHRVDRIAAVFVPIVLLIAGLTVLGWLAAGAPLSQAILTAVSVLVIACPCALGLATPAALMVGMGAAARAGILVKNAEALERAEGLSAVVFDKTGTLTKGRPTLRATLPAEGVDETALLETAARIQAGSEHPLAGAVLDAWREAGHPPPPAPSSAHAVLGKGVEAVLEDGRRGAVGSLRWLQERGCDLDRVASAHEHERWGTVIGVERDGELIGALAVADELRPTSRPAVQRLQAEGVRVYMLTGDNAAVASAVAETVGIEDFEAEVDPHRKSAFIAELRKEGARVGMVGDGINDAPALAAADLGLAVSSGTDVATHTADLTLLRGDPLLVAGALDIARRTNAKIRQNLFWAFIYNALGLPLAALGFLSPMVAGAAMALSSVSVLGNALLLRGWRPALSGRI